MLKSHIRRDSRAVHTHEEAESYINLLCGKNDYADWKGDIKTKQENTQRKQCESVSRTLWKRTGGTAEFSGHWGKQKYLHIICSTVALWRPIPQMYRTKSTHTCPLMEYFYSRKWGHTILFHKIIFNTKPWLDWRESPVVKSTPCSCRGPGFDA